MAKPGTDEQPFPLLSTRLQQLLVSDGLAWWHRLLGRLGPGLNEESPGEGILRPQCLTAIQSGSPSLRNRSTWYFLKNNNDLTVFGRYFITAMQMTLLGICADTSALVEWAHMRRRTDAPG